MTDGKLVGLVWYFDDLDGKECNPSDCAPNVALRPQDQDQDAIADSRWKTIWSVGIVAVQDVDVVLFQHTVGLFGVPDTDRYCHSDHPLDFQAHWPPSDQVTETLWSALSVVLTPGPRTPAIFESHIETDLLDQVER
jgi:hypothetical protein